VTEKILNHRASNDTGPKGKIYQRYDNLEERREALGLRAQHVMKPVNKAG
jgi:hypothetical protein